MRNGLERFNNIVDLYKEYYYKNNNKEVVNIEYKNGFVYLTTSSTSKYRISKFEKMVQTLKDRLK